MPPEPGRDRDRCEIGPQGYGRLYRNWLYPAFDRFLKRRRTVEYWRRAEASQWWDRDRLEAFQLDALRELLRHAHATCPYYRETWAASGLRVDSLRSLDDFRRWPLMRRETVRAEIARLRSEAAITRLAKATGGSSGQPLRFEIDPDSNQRRTAMTHRGYDWAGAGPGSKQFYLWGDAIGSVPTWRRWKTSLHRRFDRQGFFNCFDLDERSMARLARDLDRHRPDAIVAYTNPIFEFAHFLRQREIRPRSPRSVVVGAEKLYPFQRELIEQVFRCPVFETYGSREFMLIGAECERHEGLHLSMENLLVEIVNDDGQPTPDGDEGNVVVTDLFNHAMPFVRYVTDDRATAGFGQCGCGRGLPLLRRVIGRRLDTLRTATGRVIPGEFFPHLFKDYHEVGRFQVRQGPDDRIALLVVPAGEELSRETRRRLRDAIRAQIHDPTPIEIRVVTKIPLTHTGKHRVVVRDQPAESSAAPRQACQ